MQRYDEERIDRHGPMGFGREPWVSIGRCRVPSVPLATRRKNGGEEASASNKARPSRSVPQPRGPA